MEDDKILDLIEFTRRESLTVLDLKGQGISHLPPEIGTLPLLEELYLKNNMLQVLPTEIGNLKHLKRLSLIRNELTELPKEIANLTNLRELFVSRNKLQLLPRTIGNLKNLRTLSAIQNELESLPPQIGKLSQLTSLLLSRNKLKILPFEIVRLTSLRTLELAGNPLETPLREISQNGVYAVMSYLIGLQYGSEFENVYKHKITVRKELQTALHQYLVYFTDFVHYAKGMNIDFNVITTMEGLELQVRAQDNELFQTIGRFFKEYVELIGQRLESIHVNVEANISDTERKILIVELRSQVRNLQSAVEIRNIRLEYLKDEVNFLRRLLTSKVTHPQPIQIDVISMAEAKSLSHAKIDVKIEIAELQESFQEIVSAIIEYDPLLGQEIQPLSDSLNEIDEDLQDKTQIDLPVLERVGRFLRSLTDSDSKYVKALERANNGVLLLQKAGRAYNNIAEWLGLPQIPKVFI